MMPTNSARCLINCNPASHESPVHFVEHVTVLENSPDVMKLVAPHMPKDRVTIIEAEAVEWTAKHGHEFDCAWHDVWTDTDAGEPHLQVIHSKLLVNTINGMNLVGAWAMPRKVRRLWNQRAKEYGIYVA